MLKQDRTELHKLKRKLDDKYRRAAIQKYNS